MLRLSHSISENEYLGTSAVKNFLNKCQLLIQNAKVSISTILKCIVFLALLPVAVLPLFSLVFLVNENEDELL